MTECNQESFGFEAPGGRELVARFDGGTMSSDGGVLLLERTEQRLHLVSRLASCFDDRRNPIYVQHKLPEMLRQRIFGLALGYEDLSDHDQLRHDPLLCAVSGKRDAKQEALAGKSTLNRLELSTGQPDRYKKIQYRAAALDELLVQLFVEAQGSVPERIVLDLDVTDLPLHGHQEGRFFHGYYDEYVYLPLYIFAGEQLLGVRLRTADQDAAAGSVEIILRADSGFCREELMKWCEDNGVFYVFGMARNPLLRRIIAPQMAKAARLHHQTGRAARVFCEFQHRTKTAEPSALIRLLPALGS
jgi:hypothetical protein